MSKEKLEAVTRFVAMMLVVVYTGVGFFLLKDKIITNVTTSASVVTEDESNGSETDTDVKEDVADVADDVQNAENTATGQENQETQEEQASKENAEEKEKQDKEKAEKEKEEKEKEEKKPVFTDAPKGYFDDALFIGDSRTVGLMEYGGIKEAAYFATEGMSVYNIHKDKVSTKKFGSMSLDSLLANKKFSKVYLMLGINELGYDRDKSVKKFGELIEEIQKAQPSAIIYVEANLHVSASRSESDKIFNNKNINQFNKAIAKLADNKKVFYLDVNPLFDDKKGNLAKEYTSDNTHVLGKYYRTWTDWIATQAIVA